MSLRLLVVCWVLIAPIACGAKAPAQTPTLAQSKGLEQYDEQVNPIVERMTLAEKIGQMTQAEFNALHSLDEVTKLALGSVLCGGDSDPKAGNQLHHWTDIHDTCQDQAVASRLGIPLLFGVDAVHGHSNVLGAVIFPHNIGLGCTRDAKLVEVVNRITAQEIRATGINWNFAPCVAVPRDIRWGRTYEGFSESPELVSVLGAAAVRGLQGANLANPQSVLGCAKHFIGDGGTKAVVRGSSSSSGDVQLHLDQGDVECDLETLRRIHLAPYLPAIEAGVASIMPSYSSWNGVKCSGSKELLTDLLKQELGFQGFLISDYNAIDQITDDYKEAIRISCLAGMDMFMVPTKYAEFIENLTELVEEGAVPEDRIDDAVRRILRVKAAMGLLDPEASPLADRTLHDQFGSPERRAVAREAVRKSLVLLKNEGNLLPLAKENTRIVVAGKAADDLGIQCGGWTIHWQGQSGEVTTGGITLLEGIRQAVGTSAKVHYSPDASDVHAADVAIVVVGERPYAEGDGDTDNLELSQDDQQLLERLQTTGVPTVLVVLSGRPLVLGEALIHSQAVLAAWLPGTEGAGVADVVFGDFAPAGKLSFTWPRSSDQEPINVGDAEYDPQFEYGFGLGYSE